MSNAPEPYFIERLTACQSRLYAFCHTQLGDPHRAADVLQETNRALLEHAARYDAQRAFLPWALTFARHQVRAARQRMQRDRLAFDETLAERLAERWVRTRVHDHDERRVALARCLERLPEHQRQWVRGHYEGGRSLVELAESTGRKPGALAVALHRIRRTLAECIRGTLVAERTSS